MFAAWYERQGPASEVLQVGEMAAPVPGPGEVRVRVNLSGVNPGDTKKRGDWVGYGMPYPRIVPHSDGSGVLVAVGDDVNSSRVGRRVWVYGAQSYRPFVSKLFPRWHCKRLLRTDPLKALIIGGFVRGLSMRDVESLCEEAGLGKISKSTVSTVCAELSERFQAFSRRSLYDVKLVVLFLDAIYLPVRPSGPKEGVICAWGITETGARELVSVRLGMRESKEDWPWLGRELTTRGLAAPRLIVADGAPGLISAVEEIWPRADRQHCAVHRLRNLIAKLPKSEHNRVRFNYWSALTDATSVKDGKLRLRVLISELEHGGYEAAACCLSDDLDALVAHLRYPLRHRERWRSTDESVKYPSVGFGVFGR